MPPPRLSDVDLYAFDELRRRKAAIRTPQDRQRYDLDVWRMANEPGYLQRMGEIGESGRFMSGPFQKLDFAGLGLLGAGAVGATLGLPVLPLAAPAGAAGLAALGVPRILEGIQRLRQDAPSGKAEIGWGALDVMAPALGRLLRGARGAQKAVTGAAQAVPPQTYRASPAAAEAGDVAGARRAVDDLIRERGGVPPGAATTPPITPPPGAARHQPPPVGGGPLGGPTPTGATDAAAVGAVAAARKIGDPRNWTINDLRASIQDSNHILGKYVNHERLGLINEELITRYETDPTALRILAGYGKEAKGYLKSIGLSDEIKATGIGPISEVDWVIRGRESLQKGGPRTYLDGTTHEMPALGQYFKDGIVPYEVQAHFDRIGLSYFRTNMILKDWGIPKSAMGASGEYVDQLYKKLGQRLGEHHKRIAKRLQTGKISETQYIDELNKSVELACSNCVRELDRGAEALEKVQVSLRAANIIGGLVGGTLGYNASDDPETATANALAGAVIGGVIPSMGTSLWRSKGVSQKYQTWVFWSLLGRASPAARANLGAFGGTGVASIERVLEGALSGNWEKVAQGVRMASALPASYPAKFVKNLSLTPQQLQRKRSELLGHIAELEKTGRLTPQAIAATGRLSNLYSAGDITAVEIMTRHGLSAQEALRYTLTGVPSTRPGRAALDFLSVKPGEEGIVPMLKTTLSPFPRVSVIGLEEALKRVPGLGIAQRLGGFGGGLRPASMAQALTRSATGYGTYKGAEALAGQLPSEGGPDPRVLEVAKGVVGPGQSIAEVGREMVRARQAGATLPEAILRAGKEAVVGASPFGFSPASLITNPVAEVQRRLVPGVIGDIARGVDPAYGRETSPRLVQQAALRGEVPPVMSPLGPAGTVPSQLAPFFAQIPWLSQEMLPKRFAPVGLTGQPRFTTPEASILGLASADRGEPVSAMRRLLSRTLFPVTQTATPPAADLRDPRLAILARLGLLPEVPSARVTERRYGLPLQQTPESAAAVQSLRGRRNERVIERMLARLPPLEVVQAMSQTPRGIADLRRRLARTRGAYPLSGARLRSVARRAGAQQPVAVGAPRL